MLCKALLGQAQGLAHFRMELKPVSILRKGGGGALGGGPSGFDLWLESQLPLWGLGHPQPGQGLFCVVFWWCPLLLCRKSIPPLGLCCRLHYWPHFLGSAQSERLPVPAGISPGQGLSLLSFFLIFPASLALSGGARICSSSECGTQRRV